MHYEQTLALHEIGHCLMYIHLGLPFQFVELKDFVRDGFPVNGCVVEVTTIKHHGQIDINSVRFGYRPLSIEVLILLGGIAAETMLHQRNGYELFNKHVALAQHDLKDIGELLITAGITDQQRAAEYIQPIYEKAFHIVREKWPKAIAAADELIRKRKLTYDEVKKI